jgi:hypothetical protein
MRLHSPLGFTATLCVLACCAVLSGVGRADIVGGVRIDGPVPPPIIGPPHGPGQAGIVTQINFDDAAQPCGFIDTNPLRTAYAAQGVVFAGGHALDGGAILNQCGNFAVSGYSPPNFLAFNPSPAAIMQNGGFPIGPERLTFPGSPVAVVQMSVGAAGGGTVTITAYNALHEVLDSVSGPLASALQIFTVNGQQIAEVDVVVENPQIPEYGWVIDDLAFSTTPTAARAATWGHLKVIYR